MASHAFCFVQRFPAGLRLRGSAQKRDSSHDNTGGYCRDPLHTVLHFFLLIRI
jgi:hypothetical protein